MKMINLIRFEEIKQTIRSLKKEEQTILQEFKQLVDGGYKRKDFLSEPISAELKAIKEQTGKLATLDFAWHLNDEDYLPEYPKEKVTLLNVEEGSLPEQFLHYKTSDERKVIMPLDRILGGNYIYSRDGLQKIKVSEGPTFPSENLQLQRRRLEDMINELDRYTQVVEYFNKKQ
jgi:hypothetical protein